MAKTPNKGGGKPAPKSGKTGQIAKTSKTATRSKTVINQTPDTAQGTNKPPSRPTK